MNAIDYIILGIILLAAILGAMKGFVSQVGTIVGVVLAIIACRLFGSDAADFIVTHGTEHESLYRSLTYVLVFVAVFIVVKLLANLFSSVIRAVHLGIIDRVAGAIFSAAIWLLAMSVAVNLYLAVEPDDRGVFNHGDKPWREAVVDLAPHIMGYLTTEYKT